MMYLDLAELPTVFNRNPLWSVEKINIASFMRRDHFGDPKEPLASSIQKLVRTTCGLRLEGPVHLLCHLRYFGYCFNPVSFYYCHDDKDEDVGVIVAEIHNTPWLEEHLYVLPTGDSIHPSAEWRQFRFHKEFHVSPFMDLSIAYDWRFHLPGKTLSVHMINYENGKKLFDATLSLTRREISPQNLTRILIRYPFMTHKVTAMIYWQALRLTLKGAPVYVHPSKRTPAP